MKTLEADTTKSKPPTDLPGDPPAQSPKEESGDSKSNPHPFDAYWFGFYCDSRGIEQISERDISGWSDELTAWVHGNGWRITDRQPNLFIIFKIDPVTKNACSKKTVGESRFGKFSKCMIQSDFSGVGGSKPVASF